MKAKLLSRLGRLETQYQEARQAVMRVGSLKKLPDDYVGERQVVVVKRQQTSTPGYESCEFEERPGPEPRACAIKLEDLRGGEDRGIL